VERLRYLGITVTNTNCINEQINSRLCSGSVSKHSDKNLLSSRLLQKYKHSNIQTQGSGYCFVGIGNLASHIEGGTEVEIVREYGRGRREEVEETAYAEFLPFIPYQILLG
jgi:hypothetical protein